MIILATKSLARRKLIKKCKRNTVFRVPCINEELLEGEDVFEYLLRLSYLKAVQFFKRDSLVIGADTIIFFEDRIIRKPGSRQEAFGMLKMLSGKYHLCLTGVSVISDHGCVSFIDKSVVRMDNISDEQINDYLLTNEYIGKAGGYAIQGRASQFMKIVEGDITTVIGLPMRKLCKII